MSAEEQVSNVKLGEKEIDSKKLLEKKQDLDNKIKQFKKYRLIVGPLLIYWAWKINKLKFEIDKENELAIEDIGTGNDSLNSDKADLKAFNNYLLATDYEGRPVFVDNLDQHMALFGASGSGKSVQLFNILRQAVGAKGDPLSAPRGAGSIFIDGKGDLSMFEDFINFANAGGRLDDVLVLNFNPDAKSNSFNLFESVELTDASAIIESAVFGGGDGGNDFFKTQAKGVLANAFGMLSYIKEVRGEVINLNTLREALELNSYLVNLVPPSKIDPDLPDDDILNHNGLGAYARFWIPKAYDFRGTLVSEGIVKYVGTYGGVIAMSTTEEKPPVPEQMTVQHGYSQTQFGDLSSLIKTFPNIFAPAKNDIDFADVIFNNKLLYCMLPAMSLSPAQLEVIGSFIIGAIKNGISKALGKNVETEDIDEDDTLPPDFIFDKLRRKSTPLFLLVLDEMATFVGKSKTDIETILAQARSVGVATIVSSQDIAGLSGGSDGPNFVERILGNASTKCFLRVADDGTKGKAQNIIPKKQIKTIDAEGKETNEDETNEILDFLGKARYGFGIIFSKNFSKILVPFVIAKPVKDGFKLNF